MQNILQNSKIEELKQIYPHGVLGRNEENHVVVLDRIGLIKSNELAKVVDDEAIIGYTFHRLIYLAQHVLAPKQKVVWIFDLGGKIMQLASKKSYGILERIISQSQKYFPGLLHKQYKCDHRLYFINTPMLFDTIWNKISESINEATLSKMVHLTDDLQQLTGDASPSLLPEYLGGDQSDEILHKIDSLQNEAQVVKARHDESDDNQEPEVDFSSLKMALSGLKLGGNHPSQSVAQTPLNTQADDTK